LILPDINILLYANRADSDRHQIYAEWLGRMFDRAEPLLLPDVVITGFIRISTHPGVFNPPTPMTEVLGFVDALRRYPNSRVISSTQATWRAFTALATKDSAIRGKVVTDGYLAALAISQGARIATRDRGFGRFAKLRWFDPGDE
jgi:toxin-antitoxin system PIN domain toxin